MIGISGIAVYSPKEQIDNIVQAKKFDHNEVFVRKRLGPLKLPIAGESENTSDMARKIPMERVCLIQQPSCMGRQSSLTL